MTRLKRSGDLARLAHSTGATGCVTSRDKARPAVRPLGPCQRYRLHIPSTVARVIAHLDIRQLPGGRGHRHAAEWIKLARVRPWRECHHRRCRRWLGRVGRAGHGRLASRRAGRQRRGIGSAEHRDRHENGGKCAPEHGSVIKPQPDVVHHRKCFRATRPRGGSQRIRPVGRLGRQFMRGHDSSILGWGDLRKQP
jgi:hypothetical protein